ncbi:hypothetical protein DFH07DRAFT_766199 [Mycena maculata]|uniref:Uncharacterized protein n=1 Tax=Mycena maculata TaxID=230809 RepID=A0AAD7NVU1_9AGAR|nr:hypothetical protein DFH07DRAFT_766199 [Mycena maculata]
MAISASCTLFCTNFEVRAIHHGCPQHGHVEHGLLDKCKTLGWDGTLNSMAIMGTQLWPEPRRLVEVLFRATDSLLEQSNYSPKNRGAENTKPTIPILQIKHLSQVPRLIQLGQNFSLIKGTACVDLYPSDIILSTGDIPLAGSMGIINLRLISTYNRLTLN